MKKFCSGIHVPDNVIRNCEAYGNGDTGFLICSFPGSSKNGWPKRNRVESCCSHDNCDSVRCNADGFGAKLSLGEGNGFFNCKAFHNIDDGFDLYTKSSIGKIGPVTLEGCVAESNGWLSDEIRPSGDPKTGVGFKLGGEGLKVRHQVRYCVANDNARVGFDANSNPGVSLSACEARGNGIDFRLKVANSNWFRRIRKRLRLFLMRYTQHDKADLAVLRQFEAMVPELTCYSRQQVLSQLSRQAINHGFGSLQDYYNEVASNPEALSQMRVNLTFLGSHFFRGDVWPKLGGICRSSFRNTPGNKIRVWCAGCANGKEVYSLLMVLLDFLPSDMIDLLATDYNPEQLRKCQDGIYPISTIKEIPTEYHHYLATFEHQQQFRISSDLRQMIQTKCHSLLSDEYPGGFDLILCRNVIKFFENDVKSQVQGKLAASLNDGGYLVISDDLVREGIHDPGSMNLIQLDNTCIYKKSAIFAVPSASVLELVDKPDLGSGA